MIKPPQTDTRQLEAKVDALTDMVAELVAAQRRQQELIAVLEPIAKDALEVAATRLEGFERDGLFEMAREGQALLAEIVRSYRPEDVRLLAASAATILDTVRAVTQPEVMAMVAEAGEALQHSDELEPKSPWEVLQAGKDPDVQRGVAIAIEVLRQLGRTSAAQRDPHEDVGRARRQRLLDKRTAPRHTRKPPPTGVAPLRRGGRGLAPTHAPPSTTPPPAVRESWELAGWTLDTQGFLAAPDQWTEQFAQDMARLVGVEVLTERHWQAVNFAREEWSRTGVSPNIRRITQGSGIPTKELYSLWPSAPGKATARVAGLPKPVGCI